MPTIQLDPLDAQDLALQIYVGWVFDPRPSELDELADAVLAWTDEPELEQIVSRAVERGWGPELENDLRECLEELAGVNSACRHRARLALAELETCHMLSQIVRAFVLQCATQHAHDGLPMMFCLCCIEERIVHAEARERRAPALDVARVAVRDVNVPPDELRAALRKCALRPRELPRMLATEERREVVRQRISRIAALGARSLPCLARELRDAVVQSVAAEPPRDELWASLCRALAADVTAPELN